MLELLPNNQFPNIESRMRVFFLNRSVALLRGNYSELKEILSTIQNHQTFIDILNSDNISEIDELILKTERCLINFVSISKALVDTNRNLIGDWYEGTKFYEDYREEITRQLSSDLIIKFSHDLRNYILHYGLPQVKAKGTSIIIDDELILEAGYVLKKSTLLNWKNWSPESLQFLNEQEDYFFIDSFVTHYFELVTNFYDWLILSMENWETNK